MTFSSKGALEPFGQGGIELLGSLELYPMASVERTNRRARAVSLYDGLGAYGDANVVAGTAGEEERVREVDAVLNRCARS